jgi:hypothetical protein
MGGRLQSFADARAMVTAAMVAVAYFMLRYV